MLSAHALRTNESRFTRGRVAALLALLPFAGCDSERQRVSNAPTGGDHSADAGLRLPSCPGSLERCDSTRCMPGQGCVTCPAGSVCVEVEVSCGPAAASTAQCVADPCAGKELSCACSGAVCQHAEGSMSCTVYGREHFLVGNDRNPFVGCTTGTP